MNLKDYLNAYLQRENNSLQEAVKKRMYELSGISNSNLNSRYAIQIIIETDKDKLLLEHENYKQFRKSNDLYYFHPEDKNIPVKAHYHVVDRKTKKEIYAVNVDGTAHHRKNKGYEVPKKHAKELSALGVEFKQNNILENISIPSSNCDFYSFIIIIEE